MTDLERISEADQGSFLVTTLSASRYVLDLDAKTVTRHRGVGPGVSELRLDGQPAHLLQLVRCVVGKPMVMNVLVSGDPETFTTRTTSEVESIELAGASEGLLALGAAELATLDVMIARAQLGRVDRGMAMYADHKKTVTPVLKFLVARAREAGWLVAEVPPRSDALGTLLADLRILSRQLGVADDMTTGDALLDFEVLLGALAPGLRRAGIASMVVVPSVERLPRETVRALVDLQRLATRRGWPVYVFAAGGPRLPAILAGESFDLILEFRCLRDPEDQALLEAVNMRRESDTGVRHDWDDVATELGIGQLDDEERDDL